MLLASSGHQAIRAAIEEKPDLILLDVRMEEIDGFTTCRKLKESGRAQDIPVIFLTGDKDDAVKGFEIGAVDYVIKPFNDQELLKRIRVHLELRYMQKQLEHKLRIEQELRRDAGRRVEGTLLGKSEAVKSLRKLIKQFSESNEPLLLRGNWGAGSEAVAREVHRMSNRTHSPFIYVNCAQLEVDRNIPLFDFETLAKNTDISHSKGRFFLAATGTLFLDGIHDLPQNDQKKLRDVLIEQVEVEKTRGRPSIDVRVIAYTTEDLRLKSLNSEFDPKLANLISKNELPIPSLKERLHDIPDLVDFFIHQHAKKIGKEVKSLTEQGMKCLMDHQWPGDIQELRNVVERAVVLANDPIIDIDEDQVRPHVLIGQYRLERLLGKGGMAEVWLAKHKLLPRYAAVKKILKENALSSAKKRQYRKRLQREAEAISKLESPHTIRLFDYDVDNEGRFCYIMEFLNGMNLNEMVEKFGPLPPARAVYFLRQICRSLAEAHEEKLIHRDVKPSNIFVCNLGMEYDFIKVLDFGIVKNLEAKDLTITEGFYGTCHYTAPEVVKSGELTSKSDIYSLGCVAYWLLTGKTVFVGKTVMSILVKHCDEKPQNPSYIAPKQHIPDDIEEIVLQCLEKAPSKRPSSAMELHDRLNKLSIANDWNANKAKEWWKDLEKVTDLG